MARVGPKNPFGKGESSNPRVRRGLRRTVPTLELRGDKGGWQKDANQAGSRKDRHTARRHLLEGRKQSGRGAGAGAREVQTGRDQPAWPRPSSFEGGLFGRRAKQRNVENRSPASVTATLAIVVVPHLNRGRRSTGTDAPFLKGARTA